MTLNKFTSNSIGALQITHDKLHTDMDLSTKTLTVPTVVRGPASLTLDPATVGDNTGSVVIAGDLIVNGTTTTVNSNTVNIGDNLLVLNSDETGTPSQNSGIEIERGTSNNATLIWNETDDTFEVKVGTALADFRVETFTVTNINTTGSGSTNISAGANIELDATNRVLVTDTPFRLASMTTTQRNAIASPANGDMIYNSTTNQIESYENSSWTDTARSGSGFSSVVDDTTPQLGGNLDLNSNNITGTGDISVTGNISASGDIITTTSSGSTTNVMKLRFSSSGTHEIHVDPTNASNYSALRLAVDGDAFIYLSATSSNVFFSKPIALSNTASTITFEGATSNGFETTLGVADPTADRTITLPDNTGNIAVQTSDGYLQVYGDYGTSSDQVGINLNSGGSSRANLKIGPNSTSFSWDHWHFDIDPDNTMSYSSCKFRVDGDDYIRIGPNMTTEISEMVTIYKPMYIYNVGTSPNFVFEGATADAFETTLSVTDPTADRTITLPDADGTIMVRNSSGVVSGGSTNGEMELQGSNPRLRLVDGDSGSNLQIYNSASSADDTYNIEVDYGNSTNNSALKIKVDATDIAIFDTGGINLSNTNLGGDPANDNGNLVISHGATGQPMASIEAGATNNVIIGNQNCTSLTTGNHNYVIGKLSLDAGTTDYANILIGSGILSNGTGHNQNTVLGARYTVNQGSASGLFRNTCIGFGTGQSIVTGDYNTHIGSYSNTYYNNSSFGVAVGYQARHNHNNGVSVGYRAGYSMYSQSDYTTLIGSYAGYDMDAGDRCTFVGYSCGYSGGSGHYNTGVGMDCVRDLTSGAYNTGIGYGSGRNIESGGYNVFVGVNAGYDLTTGSNNILIGYNAGNTASNDLVSGSNNILIGYQAQSTSSSMSNTIVLGDSNISNLQCNVQSISTLSDERDKTDIQDLTLGLDFIKAMRPVQFTWNRRDGTLGTRKEVGFVAQELQEVEMDFNTKNRTHMVNDDDPSKLLAAPMQSYPILIKAIQELSAKVDSLQAEVNTLKNGG